MFKFRLASLLRLREQARDERRAELAHALRADDVLSLRQGELRRDVSQAQEEHRRRAQGGTLNVDWLLDAQRYQMTLLAELEQLAAERQRVAREIEKRRQALVEADREVRVLERLREIQRDRSRIDEERGLMKQIDESAARGARAEAGESETEEARSWAN